MEYRYNDRGEQVRRFLGTTNTYLKVEVSQCSCDWGRWRVRELKGPLRWRVMEAPRLGLTPA